MEMEKEIILEVVKRVCGQFPHKSAEELLPLITEIALKINQDNEIENIKKEIVDMGHHFYQLGYLAGASGNISVRLPDNRMLITPSGLNKGRMNREDIIIAHMDGNSLEKETKPLMKPSSEIKMHIVAYKKRPDVQAIVHCHPPISTGFASAGLALDMPVLPEAILILGEVPLVEYGTPGTWEVPEKLEKYLSDHNVFLLANHGALTLGKDLKTASHRMETLELFAQIIFIARLLGGEKLLSDQDLNKLKDKLSH